MIGKNKEPWLNRLRTYAAENLDNCYEHTIIAVFGANRSTLLGVPLKSFPGVLSQLGNNRFIYFYLEK